MVQRTPPPERKTAPYLAPQDGLINDAPDSNQASASASGQPLVVTDAHTTALQRTPRDPAPISGAATRRLFDQSTQDTVVGGLWVAGLSAAAGAATSAATYAATAMCLSLVGRQVLTEQQQQEASAMVQDAMSKLVPLIFLLMSATVAHRNVKQSDLESHGRSLRGAGPARMKFMIDVGEIMDTKLSERIDAAQARYKVLCKRFDQTPRNGHQDYARLKDKIKLLGETPVVPADRDKAIRDIERLIGQVDALQARLIRLQNAVSPKMANTRMPVLPYSSDESSDEASRPAAAAGGTTSQARKRQVTTTTEQTASPQQIATDEQTLQQQAQQLQAIAAAIETARKYAPRGSDYINGRALAEFRASIVEAFRGKDKRHLLHGSGIDNAKQRTLRSAMTNVIEKLTPEQKALVNEFLHRKDGNNQDLAR